MFVKERFQVNQDTEELIRSLTPHFGYNGFGELTFYRTYSRMMCPYCRVMSWDNLDLEGNMRCKNCKNTFNIKDAHQEDWADVVLRNTNGTFSIRKDWYVKTGVHWDESFWQHYARDFATATFMMYWMPPGRGLWAMGSDFVYERGSMALYNCAYTDISDNFSDDFDWMMDSLMHGVGVGFGPKRNDSLELYSPRGVYDFIIEDTRESWCKSQRALLDSYRLPSQKKPRFIYDKIRRGGLPIKGFGGLSSGPEPLKRLHESTIETCESFRQNKEFDSIRLKVDIGNKIGVCVVAGNVRRSAELVCCRVTDKTFMELKNYEKYPERAHYGWMSNNAAILDEESDFELLGEIAERVKVRGEPGYVNKRNLQFGRIGKKTPVRKDRAVGFNPCGEIPLEHREVCNVAETCPTVCQTIEEWYEACGYASFYCSTVSLLPTHQQSTNKVVARNRRIGVSLIDIAGWRQLEGVHRITRYMRRGYKVVSRTNRWANGEAGVPEAIRKTTVKPGGTTPKLPGKRPGFSHDNFEYLIRRIRIQENSPIDLVLQDSGIPREPDEVSANTVVYEYPIHNIGAKTIDRVPLWEQAMLLVLIQREWSDNAVSNTLTFKPKWPKIREIKSNFEEELSQYTDTDVTMIGYARDVIREGRVTLETDEYRFIFGYEGKTLKQINVYQFDPTHEEDEIEAVLSAIAPLTKSVALLPHSTKGAYAQMPEEGIDRAEYERRLNEIKPINWKAFRGSDGQDEKYCEGPLCERQI